MSKVFRLLLAVVVALVATSFTVIPVELFKSPYTEWEIQGIAMNVSFLEFAFIFWAVAWRLFAYPDMPTDEAIGFASDKKFFRGTFKAIILLGHPIVMWFFSGNPLIAWTYLGFIAIWCTTFVVWLGWNLVYEIHDEISWKLWRRKNLAMVD